MIRIVLDTSSLVSAVISPTGPNGRLLDFIVRKQLRPYVTDAVLDEYTRVFEYERLNHLDKRRIGRIRTLLERASVKVKSSGRLKVSPHGDDNRIYECAVAAKADYIVTENTKHFKRQHKMTRIITATRLLRMLEPEEV